VNKNIIQELLNNFIQGKKKFSSLYKIYGFRETINLISKNILLIENVCRLDKDIAIPVRTVIPKIPLSVDHYSKGFDIDNWEGRKELLNLRGDYGLEVFRNRFERGDYLFVGYSEGEFVGYIWIEFPPVTESGYELEIFEAFTYDGWTFEKFRGKGIFAAIQQSIIKYVRECRPDIRNIVTHVATWNKASLSGDQRAGYKIVGIERTIVLFGIHRKQRLNKKIPQELIFN
jgi:RimJ/RimL family protein N-acetyltransferase